LNKRLGLYPESVAVRIKLNDGPELVLRAALADVMESLAISLKSGEPFRVKLPEGTFELEPGRVVSVTLDQNLVGENGAQSAHPPAVPA
jgi:hypothetical protein